jgi:general L-amino acid transport system permease protein
MISNLLKQFKSQTTTRKKIEVLKYDKSFRKFFIQFLFSIFMVIFLFYLISRAFSLELGFGHLSSRAGFGLSHTFIVEYTSNDSRWGAYFTGVVNTIRVSLVGIFFATLLGIVMGLARLSKNFLISKISAGYVEFLRNTPLLIQIIFWQLVLLQLPQISNALTFGGISVWSNRGILLPIISSVENGSLWVLILLLTLIASLFLRSYLHKF